MRTHARTILWSLVWVAVLPLTILAAVRDGKDGTGSGQPSSVPRPTAKPSQSPQKPVVHKPVTPPPIPETPVPVSPPPASKASSAVAYTYNRMQYAHWPFLRWSAADKSYLPSPDRWPADGVVLSADQFKKLAGLMQKIRYLPDATDPFRPEHVFVFHDASNRPGQVIEISLWQSRAQEYRPPDARRRECILDWGEAAALLQLANLPLGADRNRADQFKVRSEKSPAKKP